MRLKVTLYVLESRGEKEKEQDGAILAVKLLVGKNNCTPARFGEASIHSCAAIKRSSINSMKSLPSSSLTVPPNL